MIQLHNLTYNKKSRKRRKVVGRGNASGHGTYSTRGGKGQTARSGVSGLKLKGLRRVLMRLPKFKGMKPQVLTQEITLGQINKYFKAGDIVSPKTLQEKNLIKNCRGKVKILNTGEISINVTVEQCFITNKAAEAIIKAGGEVKKFDRVVKEKKEFKEN